MHLDKDTLLRRANAFGAPRQWAHVTDRMLLDWVEEGLVPGPTGRGRGKKQGKAQDWLPLAYRRVLQLGRLKQQGVTRRAAQTLALWFGTADFPYEQVRDALLAEYTRSRKSAQRSMPISWDPHKQLEPESERQREALTRALGFGTVIPADEESGVTLDAILPYIATMLTDQGVMSDPAMLADLMSAMFGFGDPSLREQMIATHGAELELDMRMLKGLLADPEENEWSGADAIAAADEETLVNARDYLRAHSWQQGVLFPAMLAMMPPVSGFDIAALLGRTMPPHAYQSRFALFLHFMRRAQEKGDHGRGMGIMARQGTDAFRQLYGYLSHDRVAQRMFREYGSAADKNDPIVRQQGWQLTRILWRHGLRDLYHAAKEAAMRQ